MFPTSHILHWVNHKKKLDSFWTVSLGSCSQFSKSTTHVQPGPKVMCTSVMI